MILHEDQHQRVEAHQGLVTILDKATGQTHVSEKTAARADWANDYFVCDWEDAHASDLAHIRKRVRGALIEAAQMRAKTHVSEKTAKEDDDARRQG